jgi:type II secretory pathway pseudopilin PulG
MEKSENLVIVLLIVAIAVSAAGIVIMNNNTKVTSQQLTGKATGLVNASIDSLVSFTLSPSIVDFGNVTQNTSYNTGGSPAPFGITNTGTVKANMTVNAGDALFSSGASSFLFNSSCVEASCAATTVSTLTNFTVATPQSILKIFEFDEGKDNAIVGIKIIVAMDEPAGYKDSTVTFTAEEA